MKAPHLKICPRSSSFSLRNRIHLAVCGAPGIGKSTLIQTISSRISAAIYLENPQDYPLIPDALCDPKRWSFPNQVQFLVTKVKHQIEMMRYDGLIIQEMDASATHDIWTPTLRTLNWITSDEEKIINELFSIIHLSDSLSQPTHYVILAGSLETLKQRVQDRGVSIEVTSPFFFQLLIELECQIIPFAKQLSVPHLIINADKLRLTKEGNFPSRLVDKVLAFLSE